LIGSPPNSSDEPTDEEYDDGPIFDDGLAHNS
jgi:hypothetical protein